VVVADPPRVLKTWLRQARDPMPARAIDRG